VEIYSYTSDDKHIHIIVGSAGQNSGTLMKRYFLSSNRPAISLNYFVIFLHLYCFPIGFNHLPFNNGISPHIAFPFSFEMLFEIVVQYG